MANPHGTPIWYELMSSDPAGSKAFYDAVFGWTIAETSGQPGMDYRMIDTGGGDFVGGLMPLTPEMTSGGASPAWLFYIGVDDVDATAASIAEQGGHVHLAPFDIPGAGRAAMVADPQGCPFYIMRGNSPEASTAWSPTAPGKCSWNELNTSDHEAAMTFYAAVFGWTYPDSMPMGAMGDYVFIAAAGTTIGATMTQPKGSPRPAWQFYFRTPNIQAAAAQVAASGGTIHYGPAEVPGGDHIIVASDPQGVMFGAVGPSVADDAT